MANDGIGIVNQEAAVGQPATDSIPTTMPVDFSEPVSTTTSPAETTLTTTTIPHSEFVADPPADEPESNNQESNPNRHTRAQKILAVSLGVGALVVTSLVPRLYERHSAQAAPKLTPTFIPTSSVAGEVDHSAEDNFRADLGQLFVGFSSDQILIGDQVKFEGAPEERGAESFSDHTLKSKAEVADFLSNPQTAPALVVRANINTTFQNQPAELVRALSGEGYVPVQVTVPVIVKGTTYFHDGALVQMDSDRLVQNGGDIFWVYADGEGHIVGPASLRADCVNPHLTEVTPVPPGIEVPPKIDDGIRPGEDGIPAEQDPNIPDSAGSGSAGRSVDSSGFVTGETPPPTLPPETESSAASSSDDNTKTEGSQSSAPSTPVSTDSSQANSVTPSTQPTP